MSEIIIEHDVLVREELGPDRPALRMLEELSNPALWPKDTPSDVAERHDDYLFEIYRDTHESAG